MLPTALGLGAAAMVFVSASVVHPPREWLPAAHQEVVAPVPGTYAWPVEGPVLRPFVEPAGPYSAGHRGIDIGAPSGTPVRAAERGRVSFAGTLAGSLYVTIEHPGGVRTTYSWLSSIAVRRGDQVARRQVIGASGVGHPGGTGEPHLHLGARIEDVYIDPLLLLERRDVAGLIHLAPLIESEAP